jgi:hypothetical protein
MVTVILAVVCFGLLLALPTHASHAPHSDAFGQSYSASKAQTVISLVSVVRLFETFGCVIKERIWRIRF